MLKNLINNETPLVICDIGASSVDPTPFIDELIKNVDCFLYGFEPNEEEFKKLNSTDKKKYFNYAVGNGQIETLNICSAPGMTSILEPDFEYLKLFHGFSDWAKVTKKVKVQTKKLDDVNFDKKIDFLKIDVQGYEHEVIKNGNKTIKDCLVVQLETSPIPLYKNEKSFAHVCLQLENLGFQLHSFNQINTRCFKPVILQNNIYSGLNHLFQLDCVFVKKLNLFDKFDLEQLKKIGLILFYSFGSYDLVDYVVSKISKLEKNEVIFEFRNLMKNIKINKRY
jgi:FkbM family methyltransferase|tara:strand:+ start:235 stop:1077 length:843 start_codon:yes stop_codon:yes gene_type:complete